MSINIYSMYGSTYNSFACTLYKNTSEQKNYLKQLSSGIRINSAGDDAAGLSLTTKLNTALGANHVGKNNTQTGINMLSTADGAVSGMVDSLQRIKNLALQASNGVYTAKERAMVQKEVTELTSGIKQTYQATTFGDKKLFDTASVAYSKAEYLAAKAAGYDDNHIITSAADFSSKISAHLTGNFVLVGDIDFSSLGTFNKNIITGNFNGTLNGQGHTLSNININAAGGSNNVGIFATTGTNAFIKNLAVDNAHIVTGTNLNYIGVLAGDSSAKTIDHVQITNSDIKGGDQNRYVGGLVGRSGNTSTITNSFTNVNISFVNGVQTSNLGGFVGVAGGTIDSCYSTGNIATVPMNGFSSTMGGFTAAANAGCKISNCYSTRNVTAGHSSYAGGFIEWMTNATISVSSCYATGNVTVGPWSWSGGFAGYPPTGTLKDTFYKNNYHTTQGVSVDASVNPMPTQNWDTNKWDLSTNLPTLKDCGAYFDPLLAAAESIQVGEDISSSSQMDITTAFKLSNNSLKFYVDTQASARATIAKVDKLIESFNSLRSSYGSSINKLTSVLSTQDSRIQGYGESKSNIMDADMAKTQAGYLKTQISQNFASTMFKQTKNINKEIILGLLS